jgi:hypothetical protein
MRIPDGLSLSRNTGVFERFSHRGGQFESQAAESSLWKPSSFRYCDLVGNCAVKRINVLALSCAGCVR